jgi:hypothetical protein
MSKDVKNIFYVNQQEMVIVLCSTFELLLKITKNNIIYILLP